MSGVNESEEERIETRADGGSRYDAKSQQS